MIDPKTPRELSKNKTFCSMAWSHQFMDPTGRVKPCCRFEEHHRPPKNNLNDYSLKQLFYGPWMDSIRSKMLQGEPVDGCTRCYQEEEAGKTSLRQRYNKSDLLPIDQLIDIQKPQIRWLEMAISNVCNLACRMCDSRYSRLWFDEEKEMYGDTYSPTKISKMDIAEVFPFLQTIVHLKFTGGEPLLTQEHWQLLEKLTQERDCSDIFINYSTNCTIFPKEAWTQIWDQFKNIEFAMSFDSASAPEAEYIRWPAPFNKIEETTKEFFRIGSEKTKYSFILRTTVSLLNVWSLPETILWWLKNNTTSINRINPTHLTHPAFLSMTVLPAHIKNRVAEKYHSFMTADAPKELIEALTYSLKYMHSKDDSHLLQYLRPYLEKTDAHRKQNFFDSYPQFSDIFEGMKQDTSAPPTTS